MPFSHPVRILYRLAPLKLSTLPLILREISFEFETGSASVSRIKNPRPISSRDERERKRRARDSTPCQNATNEIEKAPRGDLFFVSSRAAFVEIEQPMSLQMIEILIVCVCGFFFR